MDELLKADFSRRMDGGTGRPLLGVTLLMIEDSRYFSDAIRLMAIRSGARLRRADSITAARKHIKIYKPDVILLDIGLPDGSGLDIMQEFDDHIHDVPVIAMSGEDTMREQALALGAKKFMMKPFFDLAQFQQAILSVLPKELAPKVFRPVVVGQTIEPDLASLTDDLLQIRQILFETIESLDARRAGYCAQFLSSVAQTAGDKRLCEEANQLSGKLSDKGDWVATCKTIVEKIETRLHA